MSARTDRVVFDVAARARGRGLEPGVTSHLLCGLSSAAGALSLSRRGEGGRRSHLVFPMLSRPQEQPSQPESVGFSPVP